MEKIIVRIPRSGLSTDRKVSVRVVNVQGTACQSQANDLLAHAGLQTESVEATEDMFVQENLNEGELTQENG